MKEVLEIKINGKFHQYLLKSEAHYISKMCEGGNIITCQLITMSKEAYKQYFFK